MNTLITIFLWIPMCIVTSCLLSDSPTVLFVYVFAALEWLREIRAQEANV